MRGILLVWPSYHVFYFFFIIITIILVFHIPWALNVRRTPID